MALLLASSRVTQCPCVFSSSEICVSSADTPEFATAQWEKLAESFMRDDTVMILHFYNHFALAFAMRTWLSLEGGVSNRQILTAKPGQRACRWISWREMRDWILKWSGYGIISLTRTALSSDTVLPCPTKGTLGTNAQNNTRVC